MELSQLAKAIKSFNDKAKSDDRSCLIRTLRFANTMEINKDQSVSISIDEVGVKKQKYTRDLSNVKPRKSKLKGSQRSKQRKLNKSKNEKRLREKNTFDLRSASTWGDDKIYVHTTLIHVSWDNQTFMIKGESIDEALKTLVAFLLKNNLLTTRQLVFFTDGARNLKKAIDAKFNYASYHIILDWYHVSHYILGVLSSALNGSIEDKRADRAEITKHIWFANIQQAIEVIKGFNDNGRVRNTAKLNSLIDYITKKADCLTGYALRKEMGYCNSSSQAEKSNDIAVASRQKHNGMSWSKIGSNDVSTLSVAKWNGQIESFIQQRQQGFKNPTFSWFKNIAANESIAPEELNAA